MKKKLVIFAVACAVLLTACSDSKPLDTPQESTAADTNQDTAANSEETGGEEETDPEATEPTVAEEDTATEDTTTEDTTETTEEITLDRADYPDNLYGPNGDKISPDEITEISIHSLEEGWTYAKCDGFTYLAEPTGISYNIAENADLYDSENNVFLGSPEESPAVFKRYSVGDSICGLTVKSAEARFSELYGFGKIHRDGCFTGSEVTFEGSLELTGYLVILTEDEYAVGFVGDIIFIPDNESQILPIMNYTNVSEEKGVCSNRLKWCYNAGGFIFKSEYPFAECGNIGSYNSALFAAVEHNVPTRVKITVDEISMSSNIDWFSNLYMRIEDIDII